MVTAAFSIRGIGIIMIIEQSCFFSHGFSTDFSVHLLHQVLELGVVIVGFQHFLQRQVAVPIHIHTLERHGRPSLTRKKGIGSDRDLDIPDIR